MISHLNPMVTRKSKRGARIPNELRANALLGATLLRIGGYE
jgi:hypothetical protein